jgi:hypothetical protein
MSRFAYADTLPIRPVDDLSVRLSFDHYQEIAQARVDDANEIKTLKGCIDLLEGALGRKQDEIERLDAQHEINVETITRLQHDRRDLLSALREIHEGAPDRNPMDGPDDDSSVQAELRGYDKAAWDAGEIARQAIDKVGAEVRVDIPRRRAS